MPSSNINFNEIFPRDIRFHIFSKLSGRELAKIITVCKQWYKDACETKNQIFKREDTLYSFLGSKIYDEKIAWRQAQKFVLTSCNTLPTYATTDFPKFLAGILVPLYLPYARGDDAAISQFFVYYVTKTNNLYTHFLTFMISPPDNLPQSTRTKPTVETLFFIQNNNTGKIYRIYPSQAEITKLKDVGALNWPLNEHTTEQIDKLQSQYESLADLENWLTHLKQKKYVPYYSDPLPDPKLGRGMVIAANDDDRLKCEETETIIERTDYTETRIILP